MADWEVSDGVKTQETHSEGWVLEAITRGLKPAVLVRRVGETEWQSLRSHAPFAAALEYVAQKSAASVPPTPPFVRPAAASPPNVSAWKAVAVIAGIPIVLGLMLVGVLSTTSDTPQAPRPATHVQPVSHHKTNSALEFARGAWEQYDVEVASNSVPAKEFLALTYNVVDAKLAEFPASERADAVAFNRGAARLRMAPLINPVTTATGPNSDILVPSPDILACRIWGSMWTIDHETMRHLKQFGFKDVRCYRPDPVTGRPGSTVEASWPIR